jgi:hypothetical protein
MEQWWADQADEADVSDDDAVDSDAGLRAPYDPMPTTTRRRIGPAALPRDIGGKSGGARPCDIIEILSPDIASAHASVVAASALDMGAAPASEAEQKQAEEAREEAVGAEQTIDDENGDQGDDYDEYEDESGSHGHHGGRGDCDFESLALELLLQGRDGHIEEEMMVREKIGLTQEMFTCVCIECSNHKARQAS